MISSVINANGLQSHLSIRKKARIYLPHSCNLIGVVDETGLLEADEIFVQTRRDNFTDKYDSCP